MQQMPGRDAYLDGLLVNSTSRFVPSCRPRLPGSDTWWQHFSIIDCKISCWQWATVIDSHRGTGSCRYLANGSADHRTLTTKIDVD